MDPGRPRASSDRGLREACPVPVDQHLFLLFLLPATVAMASPGPDMMLVLGCGMRGGSRAGLLATAGVATSEMVHITVAAAGLAAFFATVPGDALGPVSGRSVPRRVGAVPPCTRAAPRPAPTRSSGAGTSRMPEHSRLSAGPGEPWSAARRGWPRSSSRRGSGPGSQSTGRRTNRSSPRPTARQ